MKPACRALILMPVFASLSGCADIAWLSGFLRPDPPLQAARLEEEPTPRLVHASFVQSVPLTSLAQTLPMIPLMRISTVTTQRPRLARRTPAERVAAANSAALQEPSSDNYMNAIQVYNFSDGALYRLYAAPQEVSDIALQPGENLTAISAGDTTRWVVGDTTSGSGPTKQVHVLAKPFAAGLKTNLVITTDRRSYHLELESTNSTFMAAVSWTYPQDHLIKTEIVTAAPPPPPPSPLDGLSAIENLHFDYSISGDQVAWKPLRAFDDGTHVFIEFPKALGKGDAPPLFVSGPVGSRDLVNYRVRGCYYVVDQLFSEAELRFGQGRQQVVKIKRTAPLQPADASSRQVR
jgi:P-type conjugative transfer protein TrbG